MTHEARRFDVSPGQVVAARELIRRRGGPGRVSAGVLEVANLPLEEVQEEWNGLPINEDKIQAAQLLIKLRGGEQYVSPRVVAVAHAKPAAARQ